MILCPAPNDGVENADEVYLLRCFIVADGAPHFFQHAFNTFARGFDEKFAAIFAQVFTEKVEPL